MKSSVGWRPPHGLLFGGSERKTRRKRTEAQINEGKRELVVDQVVGQIVKGLSSSCAHMPRTNFTSCLPKIAQYFCTIFGPYLPF